MSVTVFLRNLDNQSNSTPEESTAIGFLVYLVALDLSVNDRFLNDQID